MEEWRLQAEKTKKKSPVAAGYIGRVSTYLARAISSFSSSSSSFPFSFVPSFSFSSSSSKSESNGEENRAVGSKRPCCWGWRPSRPLGPSWVERQRLMTGEGPPQPGTTLSPSRPLRSRKSLLLSPLLLLLPSAAMGSLCLRRVRRKVATDLVGVLLLLLLLLQLQLPLRKSSDNEEEGEEEEGMEVEVELGGTPGMPVADLCKGQETTEARDEDDAVALDAVVVVPASEACEKGVVR